MVKNHITRDVNTQLSHPDADGGGGLSYITINHTTYTIHVSSFFTWRIGVKIRIIFHVSACSANQFSIHFPKPYTLH